MEANITNSRDRTVRVMFKHVRQRSLFFSESTAVHVDMLWDNE